MRLVSSMNPLPVKKIKIAKITPQSHIFSKVDSTSNKIIDFNRIKSALGIDPGHDCIFSIRRLDLERIESSGKIFKKMKEDRARNKKVDIDSDSDSDYELF